MRRRYVHDFKQKSFVARFKIETVFISEIDATRIPFPITDVLQFLDAKMDFFVQSHVFSYRRVVDENVSN